MGSMQSKHGSGVGAEIICKKYGTVVVIGAVARLQNNIHVMASGHAATVDPDDGNMAT